MSLVQFLQFAQPALIAWLGGILFVLVVMFLLILVLRRVGADGAVKPTKIVSGILVLLLTLNLLWQLATAASVNNVNRSVIDRSGIDTQRYIQTQTP